MTKNDREVSTQVQKFVLESIDPATGCIVNESAFETDDIAGLCAIVDPGETKLHPAATYDLVSEDVEKITARFAVHFDSAGLDAQLSPWSRMHDLPYVIHTNRELTLMLNGSKPLAAFSDYLPSDPEDQIFPEKYFDPYVEQGLFSKKESILDGKNGRRTRTVLYALKHEAWRMEAYVLLWRTAEISGWNEGFERMQGSLLGYDDEQNDIFIERFFKGGTR